MQDISSLDQKDIKSDFSFLYWLERESQIHSSNKKSEHYYSLSFGILRDYPIFYRLLMLY